MLNKILSSGYKRAFAHAPAGRKAPFFKSIMVHPSQDLVFVRVPKAGCSTVIARLLAQSGDGKTSTLSLHSENPLATYERADFSERLSTLNPKRTQMFTVVRNPYTRVLSAFREKVELKIDGPRYRSELGIDQSAKINFAEFVDILVTKNPLMLDMHFMPQSLIVANDKVRYDAIFHLENMQECFEWMDAILPQTGAQSSAIAPHATNANARVKSLYTPDIAAKIEAYYADDFELLGYHEDLEKVDLFEEPVRVTAPPFSDVPMSWLLRLDNKMRARLPMLLNRH